MRCRLGCGQLSDGYKPASVELSNISELDRVIGADVVRLP